jgi:hypothetical protein
MSVANSHRIPAKLIGAVVKALPDGQDRPVTGKIYQADKDGFRLQFELGKVRCTWDQLVEVLDPKVGVRVRRRPRK